MIIVSHFIPSAPQKKQILKTKTYRNEKVQGNY
jgi:hypothetical protein